jgi:hypothetical protein
MISAVALVFSGIGLFESWRSRQVSYMQTRPVMRIESIEGEHEGNTLKLRIRVRNDGQGTASHICAKFKTLADKVNHDFEPCADGLALPHETAVINNELLPWLDATKQNIRPNTLPVRLDGHLDYVDGATGEKFSEAICYWWGADPSEQKLLRIASSVCGF